jgi:amino acid permease
LNGCTTTTIQHTIKYLGMLCKNQGLFLGFYFTTLNICIYIYTHTQNNSPLIRKRKENYERERVTPEFGEY